ncbi:MAG: hypothetical protein Q4C53_08175 [Clostridia bacterium]|nr:hypothetical protein [Clostridia bacterium]
MKAFFHLPGLFEHAAFYEAFLPLFSEHRAWFYPWAEIGSVYGAPRECLWGGGRVEYGERDPREVAALMRRYGVSARLTFSNSLLTEAHLADPACNALCRIFSETEGVQNGAIVHSDLLLGHLKRRYPGFYFVSSTTKVLTEFGRFREELANGDFRFVVPDFRLNRRMDRWAELTQTEKDKTEFLCNECCAFGCTARARCYAAVSRRNLGLETDFRCPTPGAGEGYRFSLAMENPGFIGVNDIVGTYLPMGFSNFKIEGRGLGSALLLEFILHYMTKPEHHIRAREALYLDNMLDLF